MRAYKFGDIVLVRFHPSYGKELKKYRPAVIFKDLSPFDPRYIQIAPLTTNTSTTKNDSELLIEHEALEKKSLLLSWYVMTYDGSRVVHQLGSLSQTDQARLRKVLSSRPRPR